ncbi:hypothetical protein DPEC_G00350900 [Dallia pectoralis]|uniref:Uncharacterized protein n=1 Tax=Dallia pectoralis TaxID=75939 RepID=A0ACC2F217_DALPE|nr:hypothetical protein DPEC_G00350900 [Dallia pectoralis]
MRAHLRCKSYFSSRYETFRVTLTKNNSPPYPDSAPLQTGSADGVKVSQWPPSLTVTRGQRANLSCRFQATSYGVEWFKMKGGRRILVPDSAGQSSLVITDVCVEDEGVYFCEVNVLHRDPELGNGTKLIVLVPSNTQTYQWALVCVTGGFHPNHVTLIWTHRTAEHGPRHLVGSRCSPGVARRHINQSHGRYPEILTQTQVEDCYQATYMLRN